MLENMEEKLKSKINCRIEIRELDLKILRKCINI